MGSLGYGPAVLFLETFVCHLSLFITTGSTIWVFHIEKGVTSLSWQRESSGAERAWSIGSFRLEYEHTADWLVIDIVKSGTPSIFAFRIS